MAFKPNYSKKAQITPRPKIVYKTPKIIEVKEDDFDLPETYNGSNIKATKVATPSKKRPLVQSDIGPMIGSKPLKKIQAKKLEAVKKEDRTKLGYSIYYYHTGKKECFTYATNIDKDLLRPFVNILNALDTVICDIKNVNLRRKIYFGSSWIASTVGFYEKIQSTTVQGESRKNLALRQVYINVSPDIQWHEYHNINGIQITLSWEPPVSEALANTIKAQSSELVLDERGNTINYVWDKSTLYTKTEFTKVVLSSTIHSSEKTNHYETVRKYRGIKYVDRLIYDTLCKTYVPKDTNPGEHYSIYAPDRYDSYLVLLNELTYL